MHYLGIGALLMIATDAVVGVRLLLLASRSRALPEAALGSAFLLLGALGYPMSTAARRGLLASDAANAELMAAALLLQNVGCLAIYLFAARTFRAGQRWADGVALAGFLGLAGSWIGQAATSHFAPDATGAFYYLGLASRAGAFAWAALESAREWRQARRRLRLGLSDPLVANRFLLFALGMAGVFAAFGVFLVGQLTTEDVAASGWVLATTGAVGLLTAPVTWLAFLPPAAYARRVMGRA